MGIAQAGEHLRAQRRVLGRQPAQRFFEQVGARRCRACRIARSPPACPSAARAKSAGASTRRLASAARRRRLAHASHRPARHVAWAEQQREPGDLELVPVRLALTQGERRRDVGGGLLVREPRGGVLARLAARTRRPGRSRPGRRRRSGGQARRRARRGVCVQPLDRLGDPPVEPRTARRGQLALERRPQERVCERVAARCVCETRR